MPATKIHLTFSKTNKKFCAPQSCLFLLDQLLCSQVHVGTCKIETVDFAF